MAFIGKSELTGDLVHPHIAMQQARFYQLDPRIGDVLLHCFAGVLFKIPAQISFGNAEMAADLAGPDFLRMVNILLNILQDVQRFVIGRLGDLAREILGDVPGHQDDHRVHVLSDQFLIVDIPIHIFPNNRFNQRADDAFVGLVFKNASCLMACILQYKFKPLQQVLALRSTYEGCVFLDIHIIEPDEKEFGRRLDIK